MKLLFIHSDYMEYEVKKAIKNLAEDVTDEHKQGKMEDGLTVFMSVEKCDESADRDELMETVVNEIKGVTGKLSTQKIMLYPYAHLSSELAGPEAAKEISIELETALKSEGFEVVRSPFGWYKSFKIACKGHPLSELSKEIRLTDEEPASKAVTREDVVKDITSEYLILTPEGEETKLDLDKIDDFDVLNENPGLKSFIVTEEIGKGTKKEPPSIKAMQRLELVDYEPMSDSGHFRMFPKGQMVFELLKQWADKGARKLNAMQIDTPIMYDWHSPDIQEQGSSFHERHYTINLKDEKREFVLRFAGDFGLFRMMKGATMSYKQLPLRIYEFSKSFRMEQRGELSGLKRLRAFHMPDLHSFAKNIDESWDEFADIYKSYTDFANTTGVEYAVVFRIVDEFYQKYKNKLIELLVYTGKPAYIEVLSGKKHYWVVKHEFQGIDSVGGSCQLSTVQIDVEDAARYGIVYTDKDGSKNGCIICHCSIGSIERWIYCILEDALKKDKPELPFWLAPTQLRLIPVTDEFVEDCVAIANSLPGRIDIDDRDEKVGRKIRDAEREWINLIVVFGEKEKEKSKLPVRVRSGEIQEFGLKELKREIEVGNQGFPYEAY
jgi:threonyl-tRNA synthetase